MSQQRLAVVAVGGNALISDRDHIQIQDQALQASTTSRHIAQLVDDGWSTVVTHGNGPQVGFILHRSEVARDAAPEVPLVYAVADTQGALGFMLQQGLTNALRQMDLPDDAVTIVTRVLVDRDDPSFDHPTKPIGAHLDEQRARAFADEFGWTVAEDAGRGWRRVVASPLPQQILELDAIKQLLQAGQLVIACGGGGIPVVDDNGTLNGCDAVIDKDATSSLLATHLDADVLAIVTDVDRVAINYATPQQEWLDEISADDLEALASEGHFAAGSMGPKVNAALSFARSRPGAKAVITNATSLRDALNDQAGTRIADDPN